MMKKLFTLLLLTLLPTIALAQEKISVVTLKNGTVLKGNIKSIDPTDALTIEIAGIESSIKMTDVATVEEEKVGTPNAINTPINGSIDDKRDEATNKTFIAAFGDDRLCFKVLSDREKTVELILNKNIKYKNSHCVIPSSVENEGNTYTVISIGKEALFKNKNIETVEIPNTIRTIGEEAFEYCSKLKSVLFSPGLMRIEKEAFKACPIEKIDLPNTVTYIGWRAFFSANPSIYHKSKIQWVSIPESVEEIDEQAFSRCVNGFGKSFSTSCHIELLPSWIDSEEAKRIGLSEESFEDYKIIK